VRVQEIVTMKINMFYTTE